ncbi:hypothetical protein AB0F17_34320 [Nonomuraea sp. NPDC026600]|uniref:hypothetical protein n=1 Tax=Nonomuraea sp. NPDC026600 TaxID=3155363 RepID=UPI0033FCB671
MRESDAPPTPIAQALHEAVDVVMRVEPDLGRTDIDHAVRRAASTRAMQRRLAQAVTSQPELLTCGRPDGPIVVDKLIHQLLAAGGRRVVAPLCPRCGKPTPLGARDGTTRICYPCDTKRRLEGTTCAECGRPGFLGHRNRQGALVCRSCRPRLDGDPVDLVCANLKNHPLGLSGEVLREAVMKVSKQPYHLLQLAWELEDRPSLLTGEAAHGSPRLIRLIAELLIRGAARVVMPPCPRCAGDRPLAHNKDGLRICAACYKRAAGPRTCSACGKQDRPAGRDAAGQPLCDRCWRQDPLLQEECVRCHEMRYVAQRTPEGPLCKACHRPGMAICVLCGKLRPCIAASTGMPRCQACSQKKWPCVRCGKTLHTVARTPEGRLCKTCYERDPISFKTCSRCGAVERLHHFGLCACCVVDERTRDLLTGPDGTLRPELEPLQQALVNARSDAMLAWLDKSAGATILREIAAGTCPLSHEALEQRLSSRAGLHLREILVKVGLLPARDEHLAALDRWINAKLEHALPGRRKMLRTFMTWNQTGPLRRRLGGRPANYTQVVAIRSVLNATLALLGWLDEQEIALDACRQSDIDRWLAAGNSTRHRARAFVQWAVKHQHAHRIVIPDWKKRTLRDPLGAETRWALARQLLGDDTIPVRERIAGLFVLLYAQPLTTDHLIVHDHEIHVRFGQAPLLLPGPLADLVRRHLGTRRSHVVVGRDDTSPWLFPGAHSARPISPTHLGKLLRDLGIYSVPGRQAALLDLTTQIPAGVLQRLLGLSAKTAERWSSRTGTSWAAYAAEVQRRGTTWSSG